MIKSMSDDEKPFVRSGEPPACTRKAITLRPYWAWAVCHAGKRVENRTWFTHYRGPLLIHAGKGNKKTDAADRAALQALGIEPPPPEKLVRGAIVAECWLVDCVAFEGGRMKAGGRRNAKMLGANGKSRASSFESDLFAKGPWCWVLDSVRHLGPFALRGRLGIYDVQSLYRFSSRNGP
jgi:activating signal cointegrator 1